MKNQVQHKAPISILLRKVLEEDASKEADKKRDERKRIDMILEGTDFT